MNTATRIKNLAGKLPWVATLGLLILSAHGAMAAPVTPPVATISSVSVASGGNQQFNSQAAVCNGNNGNLALSADITSSGWTTAGTVTDSSFTNGDNGTGVPNSILGCQNNGAIRHKKIVTTEVQNQKVTVVATDENGNTVPLSQDTTINGTQAGSLPLANTTVDGKFGVTFDASASEEVRTKTDTELYCYTAPSTYTYKQTVTGTWTGWATHTGSTAQDTTKSYYRDMDPPTVTHSITNTDATVMQKNFLNLNVKVQDGSTGQYYRVQAGFNDGAYIAPTDPAGTDIWGTPSPADGDTGELHYATTGSDDGKANQTTDAMGVLVGCIPPTVPESTPLAPVYLSKARLISSIDLCGGDYATTPINSNSKPSFIVTPNAAECSAATNQAVVTAPFPTSGTEPDASTSNYALVQCFTSQNAGKGKAKVVSYPGTVHLGTVINTTGAGTCDDTIDIGNVVFDLDADFDFLQTGKSPAVHVFVGDLGANPALYYHSGFPLVEIYPGATDIAITEDLQQLTLNLANTDLGCGPGKLPKGKAIYTRAHAKFTGTPYQVTGPSAGEKHTFHTSAIGLDSSIDVMENPLDDAGNSLCLDGEIQTPEPPPAP